MNDDTSTREAGKRRSVLSVAALTTRIKTTLERTFGTVWVAGEISSVTRPRSGHIYFALKDQQSQIQAVMWRSTARRLNVVPEEGQQVICSGEIDVYPPRGMYQLVVRQIEQRGEGALLRALKQRQAALAAEGLFDPRHKQPLPRFPRRIALVTSPTGAAVRDFLEVGRRRWHDLQVLVIPARVQGDGAAFEIAQGIQQANQLVPSPDVLVVGRGGGSMEDLWCFNDEAVVRAIFHSRIPVVSAVGHEIDVTLADLAADVRALTPSEAAERVVPLQADVQVGLKQLERRMRVALMRQASEARLRFDSLANHRVLRSPLDLVHQRAHLLDDLAARLQLVMRLGVQRESDRLAMLAGKLESLSPLGVLSRGYSVTQRAADGAVIEDADDVSKGDLITTRLARGTIISRIE